MQSNTIKCNQMQSNAIKVPCDKDIFYINLEMNIQLTCGMSPNHCGKLRSFRPAGRGGLKTLQTGIRFTSRPGSLLIIDWYAITKNRPFLST
jgi:hypothetical protein